MTKPTKSHAALECPYIGLKNDPGTSLAFASSGNHCFRLQVSAVPALEHQSNYCLAPRHIECPVYTQPELPAFPNSLKHLSPRYRITRKVPPRMLWATGGVVATVAVISVGFNLLAPVRVSPPQVVPTEPQSLNTPTQTFTAAPEPTRTPTLAPPTATLSPSATPTSQPAQVYALETPFRVDGREFIIHRVLEGDQMVNMVKNYNTTVEAIRSINYRMPDSVWAGSTIVISPNLAEVDDSIPAFRAFQVKEGETAIEKIAEALGVDLAAMKHYNNCETACTLNPGDWLLVPYPR